MLDSDHDKSFKNSAIKNSYEQKLKDICQLVGKS